MGVGGSEAATVAVEVRRARSAFCSSSSSSSSSSEVTICFFALRFGAGEAFLIFDLGGDRPNPSSESSSSEATDALALLLLGAGTALGFALPTPLLAFGLASFCPSSSSSWSLPPCVTVMPSSSSESIEGADDAAAFLPLLALVDGAGAAVELDAALVVRLGGILSTNRANRNGNIE